MTRPLRPFGWRRLRRDLIRITAAGGAAIACTAAAGCGDGTDVFLARIVDDGGAGGPSDDGGTSDGADAGGAGSSGGDARADAGEASTSGCAIDGQAPLDPNALLSQVVGFARNVTGGRDGCVYHVTSLGDSGAGTLREGAGLPGPAWIVFDLSGDITLESEIRVSSDKTIDGRGAAVTVHGYGLGIIGPDVGNVIIENLSFSSDLTVNNNDAIRIISGAHTIWVDHCSFSGYDDGHIDITRADPSVATDVTVSWCHFANHSNKGVMLIGRSAADTADTNLHVTAHHNWWDQIDEYTPRLRFGLAHTFNNLIDRWTTAASAVTMGGELYSEQNVFVAADNKIAININAGGDSIPGNAFSDHDLLENGAVLQIGAPANVFTPADEYPYEAETADDALVAEIMAQAGAH